MSLVSDVYKEKRVCKFCKHSIEANVVRECELLYAMGKKCKIVQDYEGCDCFEPKEK